MSSRTRITYRLIEHLEDMDKVVKLQADIWSQEVVSPLPQLFAAIHNGGIVIGAFAGELLAGFCYGFAGFKDGMAYLVSHMTGILPDFQNSGIGYELKVQQRKWAIEYGYKKIVWTYDPLEIRNGYFNICKLGAYSKRYFPAYYGKMNDKLNIGLPTDRLLVEWDICSKHVEDTIFTRKENQSDCKYERLFDWEHINGYPVPGPLKRTDELNDIGFSLPIPANIQFIKQTNTDTALVWRYAVRAAMNIAFTNGYIVKGVQKERNSPIHFYLLEKNEGGIKCLTK